MSKIKKLFAAIKLIAKQPALLNLVLEDEDRMKQYVINKYGFEQGLPLVSLETLFRDFDIEIPVFAFLDGGSLPTDIALLMKLAEGIENCKYFEIGTWRGESVVNVAQKAYHCTTLNLSDADMRTIGMNEEYIGLTACFSKGKENITHIRGNSLNFDFASLNQKFDLIFIDGDHHYEMVKNDTKKVFENLVHENSIVVWHDYARNPELTRYDVFAGILDGLPKELHGNLYHVENSLSAIYTNKTPESGTLKYPTKPKHYFTTRLKMMPLK